MTTNYWNSVFLKLEYQFDDFPETEYKKKPTGISWIGNGIKIPLPMGVPEIGTKNQNFLPSKSQQIDRTKQSPSNYLPTNLLIYIVIAYAGTSA